MDYNTYINGGAWKTRRAAVLLQRGKKCQACGLTGIMEVHHRTYDRMGAELDRDLIVLCTACHKGVHDLHRTMPFTDLDKATGLYVDHMRTATVRPPRRKRRRR